MLFSTLLKKVMWQQGQKKNNNCPLFQNTMLTLILSLPFVVNSSELEFADSFDEMMSMEFTELLEVEIATGSKVSLNKAPAVTTVITAKDIRNMGARTLVDVLASVPGMHVARSGNMLTPRFRFRGITTTYSAQALFMINGVSTKSVMRGDNNLVWGEFPINAIERIEIIRGPGSALYGADALSGIINIITKHSTEQAEAGATLGSFNTKNVWFSKGIKWHDWRATITSEYTSSDGHQGIIESDTQTVLDTLGDTLFASGQLPTDPDNVSLAPGHLATQYEVFDTWVTADNHWLELTLGVRNRDNLGGGQGATGALDHTGNYASTKQTYKVALKPQTIGDSFTVSSVLSHYLATQELNSFLHLFPEGSMFGQFPDGFLGKPEYKENTTNLEIKTLYSGIQGHQITFGMGYLKQNLFDVEDTVNFNPDLTPRENGLTVLTDTSDIYVPEASRENVYFYVQDEAEITESLFLTSGIRFDDYSDFGSTVNPRLSLVWQTNDALTTKLLYGKAFRAPGFVETLVVNNPLALGNPDVQPETIENVELNVIYKATQSLETQVSVFNYEADALITFEPTENSTRVASNMGSQHGYGIELQANYQANEHLRFMTHYSYVKATDNNSNADVGDYPNHKFYAQANWQFDESWIANAQWVGVGAQQRILGDYRDALDGYNSVNFGITKRFDAQDLHVSLQVNNAFDEDIRESSAGNSDGSTVDIEYDIPQAGRNAYVQMVKYF